MTVYIGLDIGGTKIACGAFSDKGERLAEIVVLTPDNYPAFLSTCADLVRQVEGKVGAVKGIGIGMPGAIDPIEGTNDIENIPYINGQRIRDDLRQSIGRDIRLTNDSNCIALAEAIDGAGRGATVVLGMTMGTGVAGGLIVQGHVVDGLHGLAGEVGHLPLPFWEEGDAPPHPCICKHNLCIEKAICGGGLMRLHEVMTGRTAKPPEIAEAARAGEPQALIVLDRYYEMVAKAMIVPMYAYDPDVIVISGGLIHLPGLFEEVPKRWAKYCLIRRPIKTRFVPAVHGPMACMRGAAWLWR